MYFCCTYSQIPPIAIGNGIFYLEFMFVSGLLMIFSKEVNIGTLILYPETLLKSFFKINMCQHFIIILHACKKKMLFLGQLKYLFLAGKFSRKREWIRYRKEE